MLISCLKISLSLEHLLCYKGQFVDISAIVEGYFHAKVVLTADLDKSPQDVFYFPMHATTVCPTIHSLLIDTLLHCDRIALTAGLSHMYHIFMLPESD